MYTGFNVKKGRKHTKTEKLQDEIKRLHQLLGAMIHVHERLKNERSENSKSENVPTLQEGTPVDGSAVKRASAIMQNVTDRKPTSGTGNEGA